MPDHSQTRHPEQGFSLAGAHQAAETIAPHLRRSPLLHAPELSTPDHRVFLKAECLLPTGSFKIRPAWNSLLTIVNQGHREGIVTSSSGNFAQAVAYAGRKLALPVTVVMMNKASPHKVAMTNRWGAQIVRCADSMEARFSTVRELKEQHGLQMVHPFDSPETIHGDATVGLEIAEELPTDDLCCVVPVSGGGLAAGIGLAMKESQPGCQLIAVHPSGNPTLAESWAKRERVSVQDAATICDALIATQLGSLSAPLLFRYVDEVVTVPEGPVGQNVHWLYDFHHLVTETAGALPVTAWRQGLISTRKKNVVLMLSGGNISPEQMVTTLRSEELP